MKSKDESTHIGTVVVGPAKEIRSTGFNSFPIGLDDDQPARQQRPTKYFYMEHSERNAIYMASRNGVSLTGCSLYTLALPCADCARGIVQAGIERVIVHRAFVDRSGMTQYAESFDHSRLILDECGVQLRFYDGLLEPIMGLRDGEAFDPFARS